MHQYFNLLKVEISRHLSLKATIFFFESSHIACGFLFAASESLFFSQGASDHQDYYNMFCREFQDSYKPRLPAHPNYTGTTTNLKELIGLGLGFSIGLDR